MPDAVIILGANYLHYVCAVVLGIAWARASRQDRVRVLAQACAILVLTYALGWIAGKVHYQDRPFAIPPQRTPLIPHKETNGFPSHHALFAFGCAFATIRPSWRLASGSFVCAAANGACRVAALVHSSWQIAASLLFAAIAWLSVDILVSLARPQPRCAS